jgi:positive regulator of sigma E activity
MNFDRIFRKKQKRCLVNNMENICKIGCVVAIDGNILTVEVRAGSACGTCAAKNLCQAERQNRQICIYDSQASNFRIGEEVNILADSGQGLKAAVLAYGLPLVLLLAAVIIVKSCGLSDFISSISGIIILIPYYLGVFFFQNKIKREFYVTISKKGRDIDG